MDDQRALGLLESAIKEAVRRRRLRSFLEKLLPRRYWQDAAQRLRVAQLLVGGYSYRGIEDETRTSARTIAAVDRWLREGNPHYRRVLPKRHRRRYRETGKFPDAAPSPFPFNYRGRIGALFGLDPRQR